MKKYSRPLCLFLVLILSFSLFSVNAFASEDENLIDSDLKNWNDYSVVDDTYSSFSTLKYTDGVWVLGLKRDDIRSALIYSLPNLTVGSNYKLSFDLFISPSLLEVSTVLIGFCYYYNGEFIENDDDTVVVVDSELMNNSSLKSNDWNTFTIDFKYNGSLGVPCIVISQTCIDNSSDVLSDIFYIRDVSLTLESTETEKKLDSILDFFHNLYWDLVGGDCSDSSHEHKSLFTKLGEDIGGFFDNFWNNHLKTWFDDIGFFNSNITEFFHNLYWDLRGGDCSNSSHEHKSLFETLSTNISGYFIEFGEDVKDFFRGFGNLILYFNWEGEFENPFVYEHSLIGDFVGSGSTDDGGSVENENIYYLDNNKWFPYSSNDTSITNVDGNQINFKNTSNSYFILSYSDIPIKKNCKTIIHFSVLDCSFGSEVVFRWSTDVSGNSSMTVGERVIGKYTYNIEIPCFYYDETIDISFTDEYKGYSKDYLYIKDFYIEYVPIDGSSGSTGDTGSDEEGSVEKKSVSQFFDDLIEYLQGIADDIESVIDSITAPVTLLDEFTKRFEWLFGIVTFTLMMIVVSRFIGL